MSPTPNAVDDRVEVGVRLGAVHGAWSELTGTPVPYTHLMLPTTSIQ